MISRNLLATLFIGSLAVACGGGADHTAGSAGAAGGTVCSPTGDVPCFTGIAEPCAGIHSGYDGDEFCRAAPDPGVGFQIHVGPKDYADPEELAKYLAQPGDETNWAEVVATPNDETIYWDGYYSYMRPGSHHFILFGLDPGTAVPSNTGPTMNGGGTESAVGALGGTFLAGATVAVQDAMPHAAEDQGAASEVLPHSNYAVNLHFINTKDHPLIQELWANFRILPEQDIRQWKQPITWYGGYGMNIPPGTAYTLDSAGSTCAPPKNAQNIRIQGVTGHVHANTIEYSASVQRGDQQTLLFQDFDWHDPSEFRFNAEVDNGTPDSASKTKGGYSGVLSVQPTDRFSWECQGFNKSHVNLTFSNKVYDGEMCNVFGFYSTDTKDAAPWLCAFL